MDVKGIIIRVSEFRDFDVMATLLTENGTISFLARGVRKAASKNAYLVNTFNFVNITLMNGKDGYFLKNGKLLDSFKNAKKDIGKLSILDFISELTNKFVSNNESSNVYPYLLKSLELLANNFDPQTICVLYFAKVLMYSGYSIEVNSCQKCHKTHDIIAFSVSDGGFICKDCFNSLKHIKLDLINLKEIRYIFKVDADNFSKVTFSKKDSKLLINILNDFSRDVVQIDLKSINLIQKL